MRGPTLAAIRFSLEGDGFAAEVVDEALDALEPELERARRLLGTRGGGAKAVRRLAAKGFDAGTLEDLGGFADEA